MVNDVVVLGVATRRVSGFSFKDQTRIWVLAADNPGVQLTLQRIHGGIRFQAGIKKIYDMHNINLTTLSRLRVPLTTHLRHLTRPTLTRPTPVQFPGLELFDHNCVVAAYQTRLTLPLIYIIGMVGPRLLQWDARSVFRFGGDNSAGFYANAQQLHLVRPRPLMGTMVQRIGRGVRVELQPEYPLGPVNIANPADNLLIHQNRCDTTSCFGCDVIETLRVGIITQRVRTNRVNDLLSFRKRKCSTDGRTH